MDRIGWTTAGFTLIEVLVAAALLITVAAGVAQLTIAATHAAHRARARTETTLLAAQKIDQLRSLAWTRDAAGGLLSDTSTDVSRQPFTSGGRGLLPAPGGTLERNVDGYVDYLDAGGQWVGAGSQPPSAAVYVRRWSVLPLESDPDHTRVFVVLATTMRAERGIEATARPRPRLPDDTVLVALKTRQAAPP